MPTIKRESLYRLAHKSGHVFTVTFRKKDGSLRAMNCRTGVKSHLKGGECGIPANMRQGKPYAVVFDMQKGEYRVFNVETTEKIKIRGVEYAVI